MPETKTTASSKTQEPLVPARPDEEGGKGLSSLIQRPGESLPNEVSGTLQKLDPLRRYLLEVSRYEPLSAEEEHRLALLYRKEKDHQAAYRLVTSNLRLVVKIAMTYHRFYSNVLDLIQEGNIGLMEAVKRFDPYKGARLPTYASWWIKAYIIKFMLDNFRIIRIGTTNEKRKLLFGLKKEKERLRLQGIEPTARRIAKRLNVSEKAVKEMAPTIESNDLSLDSYVGEDDSLRFVDTLTDSVEMVDERLARQELKDIFERKFREFSDTLKEREKVILQQRLMSDEPKTLRELADRYGVSREAIRLNEKTLVKKIKAYMQRELKGITELEFGLTG